jgi:hypothetical protein
VSLRVLEQLVGRGDDVFDFRAVFGFEQRDGVDRTAWLRIISAACLSSARVSSSCAGGT